MRLFGPLYERVLCWSKHRHAERYLAALSFAESSFFPVPPDVMLAPMCLADLSRAWRYAAVTTVASLLGGILGYAIGYFFFEAITPWLRSAGYWDAYLNGRAWFDRWGVLAVFVAGFSPIPYKIFTISAGVAVLNLPGFILASLVGRGARFFLVAGLLVMGGEPMAGVLQKYIERIGWGVVAVVVAIILYVMTNA
ncbi:MAG: DedA family protein [Gammaproteobacteria bacterium]|nr:DedA family protein [Gammaproteobacteria bacterium]MDH4252921.1 DedA family protein [Gammaproteobacteria bacterium]MDH5308393.1 DedA family protein [Gammaproteobacteria bacterium]